MDCSHFGPMKYNILKTVDFIFVIVSLQQIIGMNGDLIMIDEANRPDTFCDSP
jgi:hypothetical protein